MVNDFWLQFRISCKFKSNEALLFTGAIVDAVQLYDKELGTMSECKFCNVIYTFILCFL